MMKLVLLIFVLAFDLSSPAEETQKPHSVAITFRENSTKTNITRFDPTFTQTVSAVLKQCEMIKPGKTREALLQVFTTEGGLSIASWQTFVHRSCPYIKVDVEFTVLDSEQKPVEKKPTDTIKTISKPYLSWSIAD